MQTVILHVTAGASGPRCELRRCAAGGWRPVAGHDLATVEPLPAHPVAAGEHLAGLLLAGDTGRAWEELRDAEPDGMRTLVQIDAPELRGLPWERLALARKLFPGPRHPVVRARGLGRGPGLGGFEDIRLVPPLRLLVVAGEETGLTGIERGVERALAAAGGGIDAEVLVAPGDALLRSVHGRMRPHVLHATGPGPDLPATLRAPAPRLVVLNGPTGATARRLTDALLDARAYGVLTVPPTCDDTAGEVFTARLYAALAAEDPVDVAVAAAAEAVTTGATAGDGYLPALTVRVPPDQVLRFAGLPGHEGAPRTDAAPVAVEPRLELAEAQLARGDETALTTFRAAVRAAGAGRVPQVRVRLAGALARFDRLHEADAELRELLAGAGRAGRELHLLQAEVALRCGRVARAAASARSATDGHRATAVRVRAALAGHQPGSALRIATAAADAATPHGRELAGIAAAALMLLDEAARLFDEAAAGWLAQGDVAGAVRCRARAALLLVREHGHPTRAAAHLEEAAALEVPPGSAAWGLRSAAHLELLHRQGRPAEIDGEVGTLLHTLPATSAPPRRLVQAAVAALAVCSPDRHRELLDLLVAQLRRVTPAAARAVLLAGLSRVPAPLPGADRLHDLVRDADRDPGLTAGDRALLTLTLAELDRLCGRACEAESALVFVRDALPSPLARRAWWAALDRLGPPVSRTAPRRAELAALAEATDDLPMLAAAFLVERAEAQRGGDAALARRLVEDAARRLGDAPEQDTQWHMRLHRLQHEPAPRRTRTTE